MGIIYRQFKPSPALQTYVPEFWYLRNNSSCPDELPYLHKCLPFGTVKIIINLYNNRNSYRINGDWKVLPEQFLVGVFTEACHVQMPRDNTVFGINIRPEAMVKLFGIPIGDLWNDCIETETLLGKEFSVFVRQLQDATTDELRVQLANKHLMERLKKAQTTSGYVVNAANKIWYTGGNMSVDALSKEVFICRRQLERTFKEMLGVSPKMYGRICRFSRAFKLMEHKPYATWSDVTYTCGYADQAHFIRDFKAFTGEPPKTFFSASMHWH
ncbi:MAG: hypothetical protein DHS20C18_37580 [Saprospiraceae bacterium]|nr:MAG: hypothetical protein DHS20C18_37580 [Saprospiraceae bacterium]